MVLELFISKYLISDKKENFKEYNKFSAEELTVLVMRLLLALPMASIAGILAWRCNASEPMALRVLYTLLAVMFSSVYIFFYLVYRIVLKHPCKTT